jgi:tRNA dimethylallyltransferase
MQRALCIAGPTASGKTALALALARHLDAEIISMDSALVYQGMDIGTAKPSAAELAQVPHHLIDIRQPHQAYNAADFARDATRLVADINARGKMALVVGGTMLYFKALTQGLAELPQADPAIRAAIAQEVAKQGWPAMHALLAQVDAPTAARLAPNDSQRIGRALEVFRATGTPLSGWIALQPSAQGLPLPLLSLEPNDRAWLHERIGQRMQTMLNMDFAAEVQQLRANTLLNAETPSMRAVGYRQAWAAFDAGLTGDAWRNEVLTTASAATRQLAKRQFTWLRSMPQRHVLACDALGAAQQINQAMTWANAAFSR